MNSYDFQDMINLRCDDIFEMWEVWDCKSEEYAIVIYKNDEIIYNTNYKKLDIAESFYDGLVLGYKIKEELE